MKTQDDRKPNTTCVLFYTFPSAQCHVIVDFCSRFSLIATIYFTA